ncbi:prolyl oligopeptidase family serine peptidase [Candidatus Palauibacter sp.]|uniref:alpha/beta hydrolase family protein n=1 Tax=Candidatus Palauibacter sp. TaxID=3101350 RepID=UPI003CC6CE99
MSSTSRNFATALASIALACVALAPGALTAQETKPALDHEDTYRWNSIGGRTISADGEWLAYVLQPWDGDPTLVIARTDGSAERRFRGSRPAFTRDSRHLAFRVPPLQAVVDSLRLEGERGDDLPGDSLAVVTLAAAFGAEGDDAGVMRAGPIESFQIPEDGGAFVAYLLSEDPEAEEDEGEDAEPEAEEGEEEAEEEEGEEEEERSAGYEKRHEKEDGTPLVLMNLETGSEHTFADVVAYEVADSGTGVAYVASTEDEGGDGVHLVDPASGEGVEVLSGEGHYVQLAFDESGERFAFLSNRDEWEMDQPSFALYRFEEGSLARLADHETSGVPDDWWVSENGAVSISEDGERVFFGTAPRPEAEPDEEILDDDRVNLDIWNWKDDYLQPMQLVQANRERNRSYLAVVHEGRDGAVQLGTANVPEVERTETGMSDYVLATTDMPHRQEISWDGRYEDAYAVDVVTGERRMVVGRVRGFGGASLSPDGTYASWWDEADRDWKAAPLDGSAPARSLTGHLPVAFFNELDDHPQGPPPYGAPVWVEGDAALIVPDRNDTWRLDPSGDEPALRLTAGREANVRYRVQRVGEGGGNFFGFGGGGGGEGIEEGEVLFSVFDMGTKAAGYARGRTDEAGGLEELVMGDMRYGSPTRAEDADRYMWTRETFVEFPDVWVGDTDFANARKLSDANPQQAEYRWGGAELMSWMSADRTPLDGLLIKPDGFDPSQQYPLMVYFYERMSDGLHSYQPPVPNRASVRFSFYASRGYVVFVPDIPYEIGYPGESALDAVVPGVLSLIEQGFIDPDRVGVQGHSWGGYQIAYMITKTNIFAAAEAGAPVSNMTSAYGGIRWQTGMSRMFQYERTQSRIGGTLWDERDRYVHNSPLFFADKIQTPLLMLHNDEDGAVPWYQGIEMFVAMRRLGLPVFMLNYNGEGHGLGRQPNREDWAIRMQQFFDYYLVDAPAPRWMEEGVPAVVKGRELGLELIGKPVSEEGGVSGERGGSGR